MNTQKLKLDCIKYAAKVVATMEIENKSKALFDLAKQIEEWAGVEEEETPKWWKDRTTTVPLLCAKMPQYPITYDGTTSTATRTDNTNKE